MRTNLSAFNGSGKGRFSAIRFFGEKCGKPCVFAIFREEEWSLYESVAICLVKSNLLHLIGRTSEAELRCNIRLFENRRAASRRLGAFIFTLALPYASVNFFEKCIRGVRIIVKLRVFFIFLFFQFLQDFGTFFIADRSGSPINGIVK